MKLELLQNSNLLVGRAGSMGSQWPWPQVTALLPTNAHSYSLKKDFSKKDLFILE